MAKVLESFSFNISPSNEHSGLIFFRMDWLDLLAGQGTLKSLLQHHSSKASILWWPAFSHPYMTTGKTIALTRQTFAGKVMSLPFFFFFFSIMFYLLTVIAPQEYWKSVGFLFRNLGLPIYLPVSSMKLPLFGISICCNLCAVLSHSVVSDSLQPHGL